MKYIKLFESNFEDRYKPGDILLLNTNCIFYHPLSDSGNMKPILFDHQIVKLKRYQPMFKHFESISLINGSSVNVHFYEILKKLSDEQTAKMMAEIKDKIDISVEIYKYNL